MTLRKIQKLVDNFAAAVRTAENKVHTRTEHGEFTSALEAVVIARRTLDNALKELVRR